MIQISLTALIIALLFGVPIAFSIGIAGAAGIAFGSTMPWFMIPNKFFDGLNSFSYMAVPLFILAGAIMGKGGISNKIVNFAASVLSWLRGGVAITSVGASMIFASVSGSGDVEEGLRTRVHSSHVCGCRQSGTGHSAKHRHDRFWLYHRLLNWPHVRWRYYPRVHDRYCLVNILLPVCKKA